MQLNAKKTWGKMLHFILIAALTAALASCAFVSPIPPRITQSVHTIVMWCDTEREYTEWEVRENYFFCTGSGTIWRFAD